MKRLFALALAAHFLAVPSLAAEDPAAVLPFGTIHQAEDLSLDDFLWQARIVMVFADTPADPRLQQQLDMLNADLDELAVRDVLVLVDTDPDARGAIRAKLRPRGFQMVLVGKDGGVKLRKPLPYSVREISRTIDKMPMRQQEVRDRRALSE